MGFEVVEEGGWRGSGGRERDDGLGCCGEGDWVRRVGGGEGLMEGLNRHWPMVGREGVVMSRV